MSRCVLTLPIKTEKWQADVINKRLEIQRQVYNAMLGYELKKFNELKRNPEYKEATNTLYECASNGRKGCAEYKAAGKRRTELLREYGLSEFTFVTDANNCAKHFSENMSSVASSLSIGKVMWRAFDTMLFGKGDIVHFKKVGTINSVATDGKSFLRIVDASNKTVMKRKDENTLFVLYGLKGHKVLKMPIKFSLKNEYELEMLAMPIKQVRLLRRKEKGVFKYYVQLCLDGEPAIKFNKETGELKHPIKDGKVGVYITTKNVTVATPERIINYSLSEGCPNYSDRITELQRYMDNSRRASNPENFNDDGTIKKGIMVNGERQRLKWTFSNRYKKAKDEVAELKRLEKVHRELHHQKLANEILALGNDLRINEYSFKMAMKRSEKDELKENGTPASKKRGGKNIGENAPSMLISMIERKLANVEDAVVTKYRISDEPGYEESRYDGDKWSAFLLNL